jgi:RNA polymerase sigma factor (sigma-70 family)
MPIPSGPERDTEAQLPGILSAFLSGADGADDRLCSVLYKPVIDSVRAFLGRDNQDVDDVVQESLVAVLGYLRKRGEFEGNLVRFAVTIARNRCRNILIWRRRHPQIHIDPLSDWIAAPGRTPLDAFLYQELLEVLQDAMSRLGQACHDLIHALFIDQRSAISLLRDLHLTSVRSVYYRREACLQDLYELLNHRLSGGSKKG